MNAIKTRLKILLIIFSAIMVTGTLGFMYIESKSLIDSAYFVIVTMATVGYGDIHPVTEWGKLFAIALVVMGVGTFLGVIANVTEIMLAKREFESRMEKLNMVIGLFFSEIGLVLMGNLAEYDPNFDALRPELIVKATWSDKTFIDTSKDVQTHDYTVNMGNVDLLKLKGILLAQRDFLVRLLENPVLMEHQSFTDLLRAVFHLAEELSYRNDVANIPRPDREHLANDIKRIYHQIVSEWLQYMRYLKNNYPFLFSLAVRTNPFDRQSSVIISE